MKKILFAGLALALTAATAYAIETTGSLTGKAGSLSPIAEYAVASDVDALTDAVAELSLKYAALTSAVAFIERKCETDASWRKAYHQGVAAQSPVTNEYGIVYNVTVYNDGYTYADYRTTARKALTKAEEETRQKELIERRRLECIEAMRKAQLPANVLQMLEMRRKAAAAQNLTVEATK